MRVRLVTLAAVMAAMAAHAQEPPSRPQSRDVHSILSLLQAAEPGPADRQNFQGTPGTEVPLPPDPPAGNDAWSLRVHTCGGFNGQGIGSVTISSNGQVGCGPAPCATPVATASLRPVITALRAIIDAAWIRRTPSGLCRDCIQTTIALKRREGDSVRTFVATWDDSQQPAPELRELRRLAFELRDARIARRSN